MENKIIISSCHCGSLKLEIEGEVPEALTSCNCSFCRRSGALMAYYPKAKIKVLANPGSIREYIWGDKCLAHVSCNNCGSYSHWRNLDPAQTERMGVNARLFENVDLSQIRIRRFDGADTWKFLD